MAILSTSEVLAIGFKSVGVDVSISTRASIYGACHVSIGDCVRIDDFCVISGGEGGIRIGSYVHIAVYTSLIGAGRITIGDFANLSSRVSVYSSSDDYSGKGMTNPLVSHEFKNVHDAPVTIGRHVIVGSGSVILPGVTLSDGAAVGALSLVKEDCGAFGIYAGVPARRLSDRQQAVLDLERRFLEQATEKLRELRQPNEG